MNNAGGKAIAVIGTQYGDEGKAKIVDILSEKADYVVRYQGGANAGHTIVVNDKKIILHQIPSGIIRGKKVILGGGMAIDPWELREEINYLESLGYDVKNNLIIDPKAHLVLPEHIDESKRGNSTGKGIAPCYGDKVKRKGIRFYDLLNLEEMLDSDLRRRPKLRDNLEYLRYNVELLKYVEDSTSLLFNSKLSGRNILFECAQGTGLDVDHGQYPETTSSNPSIGGVLIGSGVNHKFIDKVVGVAKAYVTRVDATGSSPLVTRAEKNTEEKLRRFGGEYGSTTGRPRRCGWFDVPLVKHSIRTSGIDKLVLTKLDILSEFEEILLCTHYDYGYGATDEYIPDAVSLRRASPIYERFDGWHKDIGEVKKRDELPKEALKFVERLENLLELPIDISVGPERKQVILNGDYW